MVRKGSRGIWLRFFADFSLLQAGECGQTVGRRRPEKFLCNLLRETVELVRGEATTTERVLVVLIPSEATLLCRRSLQTRAV